MDYAKKVVGEIYKEKKRMTLNFLSWDGSIFNPNANITELEGATEHDVAIWVYDYFKECLEKIDSANIRSASVQYKANRVIEVFRYLNPEFVNSELNKIEKLKSENHNFDFEFFYQYKEIKKNN